MDLNIKELDMSLTTALEDLQRVAKLTSEDILVVGCSTSEVAGEYIGSAGTVEIAEQLFSVLQHFKEATGAQLAFQCCEHLNRALVVERQVAKRCQLDVVSVIPVPSAGGSMAAYAFTKMESPVVVESIQADAGIDIGDTFIGMHLKSVAVPVRSESKSVGFAHVTMAKTRPKLIGGARAVYKDTEENNRCH